MDQNRLVTFKQKTIHFLPWRSSHQHFYSFSSFGMISLRSWSFCYFNGFHRTVLAQKSNMTHSGEISLQWGGGISGETPTLEFLSNSSKVEKWKLYLSWKQISIIQTREKLIAWKCHKRTTGTCSNSEFRVIWCFLPKKKTLVILQKAKWESWAQFRDTCWMGM